MSVVLRLDHGGGRVSLPLRRRAHVRDRIAAEIERLIDMLDEIDGDLDAEPDLGWPEGATLTPSPCTATSFRVDRTLIEADPAGDSHGFTDDREDDAGDDREPDEDREPILGWTNAGDQADPARFGDPGHHDEDEASRQPPIYCPPTRGGAAPCKHNQRPQRRGGGRACPGSVP